MTCGSGVPRGCPPTRFRPRSWPWPRFAHPPRQTRRPRPAATRTGPSPRGMPTSPSPAPPTEATIAAIWADVLCVPQVGVESGFYELGGHSLLATRVISEVNRSLGREAAGAHGAVQPHGAQPGRPGRLRWCGPRGIPGHPARRARRHTADHAARCRRPGVLPGAGRTPRRGQACMGSARGGVGARLGERPETL